MKTGDRVKIVQINRSGTPTDKEIASAGKVGIIKKASQGGMLLVAYGKSKAWFFEDELEVENEA